MSESGEHYRKLYEIFRAAREIESKAAREAYLDRACEGDGVLRDEAVALLRVGREQPLLSDLLDTFIDQRRVETERVLRRFSSAEAVRSDDDLPQQIGPYRVTRVLGRGGMGVVYEAEQPSPRRRVAIKIISPAAVAPSLLRRFQHESEVLGRLQHPGIAQIYEAGTCDLGAGAQPFFAMEFVEGESLLAYAESQRLGTRARLDLIARVCDAVQHAHQRGVIHRDLKPANVLVTGDGQPKVLDFGVARATDADLQATTVMTDAGSLVGTVPYMSPEQARGDAASLDTRSDVYALGVIAYQLLTGRMPYDLGEKMVHEAVRVIVEDDPTAMSAIDRSLRGDVETVIGKALEKEPDRRYESAAAFASDVRRYLNDEPVSARPPSAAYQFRKYARRNRGVVTGVLAAFVALAERDGALKAERARLNEVQSANQFLYRMLLMVRPQDLGEKILGEVSAIAETASVSEFSASERERFARDLRRLLSPAVRYDLGRNVIKDILLDNVEPMMEGWLRNRAETRAMLDLALTDQMLRLSFFDEAGDYGQRALERFDEPGNFYSGFRPRALRDTVSALSLAGRYEEAASLLEDTDLELSESLSAKQHLEILGGLHIFFYERQQYERSEAILREMMRVTETTGVASASDPRMLLATTLRNLGEQADAADREEGPRHGGGEHGGRGRRLERGESRAELIVLSLELAERFDGQRLEATDRNALVAVLGFPHPVGDGLFDFLSDEAGADAVKLADRLGVLVLVGDAAEGEEGVERAVEVMDVLLESFVGGVGPRAAAGLAGVAAGDVEPEVPVLGGEIEEDVAEAVGAAEPVADVGEAHRAGGSDVEEFGGVVVGGDAEGVLAVGVDVQLAVGIGDADADAAGGGASVRREDQRV